MKIKKERWKKNNMMTIEELIIYGKKHIHKDQTILLLSSLLEVNYFDIYQMLDKEIDQEIVDKFKLMIKSIEEDVPIQYLLGYASFYGYTFKVNKDVLIPRFETEELVNKTKEYIKKYFKDNLNICDIGTGSGAIAITLKKLFPNSSITAVDISKEALEVAKENAKTLEADINFIEGNMLDNLEGKYDVLISNPPYLTKDDEIEVQVIKNEPHLALFAADDGLKFYKEILSNAKRVLNDRNLIAFEIGDKQKERIFDLVEEYFPTAKKICIKDYNDYDRYIFIFNNLE
jgi:release factor glutamine methyltransferase